MRWSGLLLCAILLTSVSVGRTGGIRSLSSLTPPRLAVPVTVDGDLREWAGSVPLFIYSPLQTGENVTAEVAAALDEHADSLGQRVEVRAGYDDQALYLALMWVDPMLARGNSGLAVHLYIDRPTTVECWTAGPGQPLRLTVVPPASSAVGGSNPLEARLKYHPDQHGYDQELRLPWSLLSTTGGPTSLRVFLDFAWSGLGPDFLRQLPRALLHPNCAFSYDFLTAEGSLGATGYLPNPDTWGTLVFGGSADDDHEIQTPLLRSATSLAVPRAPGALSIDGSLADWVGVPKHLTAWAPDLLGTRYSAGVSVCYDNQALYLALVWSSALPMFNLNPAALGQGFNGGDCLQFRVRPTGMPPAYYCAWYDTTGERPALTLETRQNQDLLPRGAQQAFRAEGNGYIQEIALPWSVITADGRPPAVGERWPAVFQLWWAGLDSRFTVSTEFTLERTGRRPAGAVHASQGRRNEPRLVRCCRPPGSLAAAGRLPAGRSPG